MKTYRVTDYYEGVEHIAVGLDSLEEAIAIRDERIEDTDGECSVEIFEEADCGEDRRIDF